MKTVSPLVAIAKLAKSRAYVGPHGLPVLLALATHANEDGGRCFPSMRTIAECARISERAANDAVSLLRKPDPKRPDNPEHRTSVKDEERLGLITVVRSRAAEGRQGPSHYFLDVEAMVRLAEAHPRVRDVQSEASLHETQPVSMHDVQSGSVPDCTERGSRLHRTTSQTAPHADELVQELVQEQVQGERARDIGSVPSAPESGTRGPRPLAYRREEAPYFTAAFAEGVAAVSGRPYVVERRDIAALDDAIDTHAPSSSLSERIEWVRSSATAFRTAVRGHEEFHGKGGPRGWLQWLNNGARDAAWIAMTPAQREEHERDTARRTLAVTRRKAEAAKRPTEPEPEQFASVEERARAFGDILAGLGRPPALSKTAGASPATDFERMVLP